jgi:hypothetical protein
VLIRTAVCDMGKPLCTALGNFGDARHWTGLV